MHEVRVEFTGIVALNSITIATETYKAVSFT